MNNTIESKFFEAFKWGGVVNKCIDWMRYNYNLPPTKPSTPTKERGETPEQKEGKERWDKYYMETLPKEILEATKAFDDSVIMYIDSPLMNEIEANLNECQTDAQRERYLFSLLKPFGEEPNGCGIARVYEPTAELNRLKEAIRDCEKDKAFWQTLPEDEQLKNVNGEPSGTLKKQIEACNSRCKRFQEQIDWVLYVNHQFIDLTCTDKDKEGSVEWCLSVFVGVMKRYANRLDALLLTYGIDLLRLQRESGLYLKDHRLITDIDCYIGSRELAKRYIDALPKEPQPEQADNGQTTDAQSLNPEPQQEQPKPTRGRGKPLKTFVAHLVGTDLERKQTLNKLHILIDGRYGKDAVLYIKAAVKRGLITKPTYATVQKEFGDIGCKQNFDRFMNRYLFTDEELNGAICKLNEQ